MNSRLNIDISLEEVLCAHFFLNSEKALGPNRLTTLFYQRFWDIVGPDLHDLMKDLFISGVFDEKLNETNICLIPISETTRKMMEIEPNSLYSVCYKVISKILGLRLKKLLPDIISKIQSVFVVGRLITYNILIAQKNFHALRSNPACKNVYCSED